MLQSRDLWSDSPPEPRTKHANYPTLLFSWWCTGFAAVIILVRVCGRKIRVGRVFSEDWIMLASLIPLFIRMGLVHIILLYGTNNVRLDGITAKSIHNRSIGARLVLASRIFYAMFIWVSKLTVSEFLKRLSRASWKKSHERGLHFIRVFLLVTFIAVVIATLTECQPFNHYWQVYPDPGPRCRQGFAQLITMGVADMITDLLLVCWPIPIIIRAGMPFKRKVSLIFLFSLSLGLIGITGARVPLVIAHYGRQQYRTVWASAEILASAAVANAVVLGSFVRDRGVKRNRFRPESTFDSLERPTATTVTTRRPTIVPNMSYSDEDLFRSIGCRVPAELCEEPDSPIARPAPAALTADDYFMSGGVSPSHVSSDSPISPGHPISPHGYGLNKIPDLDLASDGSRTPHDSADALPKPVTVSPKLPIPEISLPPLSPATTGATTATTPSTVRKVSFWDVGGLLEDQSTSSATSTSSNQPATANPALPGITTYDFAAAATSPAYPTLPALAQRPGQSTRRSSSRNLFSELSGRFSPIAAQRRSSQLDAAQDAVERERASVSTFASSRSRRGSRGVGEQLSQPPSSPPLERDESGGIALQDVGGLLK